MRALVCLARMFAPDTRPSSCCSVVGGGAKYGRRRDRRSTCEEALPGSVLKQCVRWTVNCCRCHNGGVDRLDAMDAFVAVADLRGFAPAARRLRVSPSTVTRLVAALEERLGARLLRRT